MSVSDDQTPRADGAGPAPQQGGVDGGRRSLLRGAAAATPVLATVVSTPVHAVDPAGALCLNPSGFISQDTFASRHPGMLPCTSNGPTFFRDQPNSSIFWPNNPPPNTQSVQFINLFGAAGSEAVVISNKKLREVLQDPACSALSKYCIAAYLNARAGTPGFPISTVQAIAIWAHFRQGATATFIPAFWGETTHAIPWFQTLMPN